MTIETSISEDMFTHHGQRRERNHAKKRGSIEVVKSILKCINGSPCNKTEIMLQARIDTRMSNRYFAQIEESGLIRKDNGHQYKITNKGIEFLMYYEKLNELLLASQRRTDDDSYV